MRTNVTTAVPSPDDEVVEIGDKLVELSTEEFSDLSEYLWDTYKIDLLELA